MSQLAINNTNAGPTRSFRVPSSQRSSLTPNVSQSSSVHALSGTGCGSVPTIDQPAPCTNAAAVLSTLQSIAPYDRAIRLPEVLTIVGVSKSTWYARLNPKSPFYDPRAPRPFKLGTSDRSPSAWSLIATLGYIGVCAGMQNQQ
jgi:predicted DNA-binding transcriptional regulator AlpA